MAGVEFQQTPNPNAGKFTLGRPVAPDGTSRSYHAPEDAADDALASALFDLQGVRGLFMVSDFVTVSKTADADWDELAPRVIEVLERGP